MARFIYTKEHLAFIATQYKKMGVNDVTVLFNEHFNLNKTPAEIKGCITNHKIKCGRGTGDLRKGTSSLFTKDQVAFIKRGYKKWTLAELTEKFNLKFGTAATIKQIRSFTRNHGISSGRTGYFEKGHTPHNAGTKGLMKSNSGSFKKGNVPLNHRPIGSERINRDGYIEVKTAEPRTWRLKHQIIWELNFGKIPPKHMIRMKDGDPSNVNIDNLFIVTMRENAILNQRYKVNQNPMEFRDTLILLGRMDAKTALLEESTN